MPVPRNLRYWELPVLFSKAVGWFISCREINPCRLATFPIAVSHRSFPRTRNQSQNYFEMGSVLPLGPDTATAVAAIHKSQNRHELPFSMVKINRRWLRKSKHGMLFKFQCVELNNFMKNVHFVWHGITSHERCFRVSLLEKLLYPEKLRNKIRILDRLDQ